MDTLNTIEDALELHSSLRNLAPHPGAIKQLISDHGFGCGAANQPAHQLDMQTRIAKSDIPPDDSRYSAFLQGFYCVQINISARWGGKHHDMTPRVGTEIDVHILDRLAGVGMAEKSWHTASTLYGSDLIAISEIESLIVNLLKQ